METIAIGVDLGGTKIACAAVDHDGHILATHTEPTLSDQGVDAVIGRIATAVNAVSEGRPVAGIGIGSPGAVVGGTVLNAVNLNWRNVPLVELVRQRLNNGVPVWAHNDVNAAVIGELVFGAARGVRDFTYLAVGTGVGGGAVSDGRVITGAHGLAMELGHMSVDPHGRLCNCGNHGCVEMYCSGKGLVAGAKAHLPEYPNTSLVHAELNTRAILTAARAGDKLALRVIEEAADVLGQAMAWSAMAFNPTLIVIGGGMAQAADDLLFDRAEAAMRMRLLPDLRPLISVVRSQVESSAVGAAALVWHALAASD